MQPLCREPSSRSARPLCREHGMNQRPGCCLEPYWKVMDDPIGIQSEYEIVYAGSMMTGQEIGRSLVFYFREAREFLGKELGLWNEKFFPQSSASEELNEGSYYGKSVTELYLDEQIKLYTEAGRGNSGGKWQSLSEEELDSLHADADAHDCDQGKLEEPPVPELLEDMTTLPGEESVPTAISADATVIEIGRYGSLTFHAIAKELFEVSMDPGGHIRHRVLDVSGSTSVTSEGVVVFQYNGENAQFFGTAKKTGQIV